MSQQLKAYDLPKLIALDKDEHGSRATILPGSWVSHIAHPTSLGIALSRRWIENDRPMQVEVLWTVPPPDLDFPAPRRVNMTTIANEIVAIQPMTLPAGLIFYLDYTYGSGSRSGSV